MSAIANFLSEGVLDGTRVVCNEHAKFLEGAISIDEFIKKVTSLDPDDRSHVHTLNFKDACLRTSGLKCIAEAQLIASLPNLKFLNFYNCSLRGEDDLKIVWEIIKDCPRLVYVDISGNKISEDVIDFIDNHGQPTDPSRMYLVRKFQQKVIFCLEAFLDEELPLGSPWYQTHIDYYNNLPSN